MIREEGSTTIISWPLGYVFLCLCYITFGHHPDHISHPLTISFKNLLFLTPGHRSNKLSLYIYN